MFDSLVMRDATLLDIMFLLNLLFPFWLAGINDL
jgi:hypothetical protein